MEWTRKKISKVYGKSIQVVRGFEKQKEVFIENFLLVPMLRVGTGLTLRDTSTLRDSTGLIGDV